MEFTHLAIIILEIICKQYANSGTEISYINLPRTLLEILHFGK